MRFLIFWLVMTLLAPCVMAGGETFGSKVSANEELIYRSDALTTVNATPVNLITVDIPLNGVSIVWIRVKARSVIGHTAAYYRVYKVLNGSSTVVTNLALNGFSESAGATSWDAALTGSVTGVAHVTITGDGTDAVVWNVKLWMF